MTVGEAQVLLGLEDGYTAVDLVKAFRRKAVETHPDHGGDTDDFLLVKRAKELLGRVLEGEFLRSDDEEPEEEVVEEPPAEAEVEPAWADDGYIDGAEDQRDLGLLVGKKLSVLHIEVDGRAHPAPQHFRAWVELTGKDKDRLSIAFQPPAPMRFASSVACVLVFDGDELGDAVGLSGSVIGRSHDADSMVTMFCVDPFGR